MHKTILAGSLVLTTLLTGVYAQSEKTKPAGAPQSKIGKVNVDFQKATLNPSLWHLMGNAKITSNDYDLIAADIKISFMPGTKTKPSALSQAVAEGGVAPNSQVLTHIRQLLKSTDPALKSSAKPQQSVSYEIFSDQAVYLPVRTRPGGGKINFTGHVKIITTSSSLTEPSISTFESASVLLGAGEDYPQIDTGAGHITLTPNEQ
ncbi:MAG: hypothetical protein ACRYFS_21470 [Janthinobacterium lividum]